MDKHILPDTHDYYMGIAKSVRRKANCRGSKVGAVIVKDNRIISTGYNGVPEGMRNCLDGGCFRCTNPDGLYPSGTGYDLCICVHAEQNALLSSARFGIAVAEGTIYTTKQPCFSCAKSLLQAKVETVYFIEPWRPSDPNPEIEKERIIEYEKILTRIRVVRQVEDKDFQEHKSIINKEIITQHATTIHNGH